MGGRINLSTDSGNQATSELADLDVRRLPRAPLRSLAAAVPCEYVWQQRGVLGGSSSGLISYSENILCVYSLVWEYGGMDI